LKPFVDAGVRVMYTFGGDFLPLASWERRGEIAKEIAAWVVCNCSPPAVEQLKCQGTSTTHHRFVRQVENNLTGIHNDWETHGDGGVDSYKFYEFWGAVAEELHPLKKEVGTCIAVGSGELYM
jgi:hypothetical protein